MPNYKVDIDFEPDIQFVEDMIDRLKKNINLPRNKALLGLTFISGARPTEIRLLVKEDLVLDGDEVKIEFETLKIKKKGFYPTRRTLTFTRSTTPFMELIINYFDSLGPEEKLFKFTLRRLEQIIESSSEGLVCPYTFRHSRYKKFLRSKKVSLEELKSWKGSKTLKSVEPYLRVVPTKALEID